LFEILQVLLGFKTDKNSNIIQVGLLKFEEPSRDGLSFEKIFLWSDFGANKTILAPGGFFI